MILQHISSSALPVLAHCWIPWFS